MEVEWEEFKNDSGQNYYFNRKTGKTQWDKPDIMKESTQTSKWERFFTAEGTPYYYNKETNQTQWDEPQDFENVNEKKEIPKPKSKFDQIGEEDEEMKDNSENDERFEDESSRIVQQPKIIQENVKPSPQSEEKRSANDRRDTRERDSYRDRDSFREREKDTRPHQDNFDQSSPVYAKTAEGLKDRSGRKGGYTSLEDARHDFRDLLEEKIADPLSMDWIQAQRMIQTDPRYRNLISGKEKRDCWDRFVHSQRKKKDHEKGEKRVILKTKFHQMLGEYAEDKTEIISFDGLKKRLVSNCEELKKFVESKQKEHSRGSNYYHISNNYYYEPKNAHSAPTIYNRFHYSSHSLMGIQKLLEIETEKPQVQPVSAELTSQEPQNNEILVKLPILTLDTPYREIMKILEKDPQFKSEISDKDLIDSPKLLPDLYDSFLYSLEKKEQEKLEQLRTFYRSELRKIIVKLKNNKDLDFSSTFEKLEFKIRSKMKEFDDNQIKTSPVFQNMSNSEKNQNILAACVPLMAKVLDEVDIYSVFLGVMSDLKSIERKTKEKHFERLMIISKRNRALFWKLLLEKHGKNEVSVLTKWSDFEPLISHSPEYLAVKKDSSFSDDFASKDKEKQKKVLSDNQENQYMPIEWYLPTPKDLFEEFLDDLERQYDEDKKKLKSIVKENRIEIELVEYSIPEPIKKQFEKIQSKTDREKKEFDYFTKIYDQSFGSFSEKIRELTKSKSISFQNMKLFFDEIQDKMFDRKVKMKNKFKDLVLKNVLKTVMREKLQEMKEDKKNVLQIETDEFERQNQGLEKSVTYEQCIPYFQKSIQDINEKSTNQEDFIDFKVDLFGNIENPTIGNNVLSQLECMSLFEKEKKKLMQRRENKKKRISSEMQQQQQSGNEFQPPPKKAKKFSSNEVFKR